LGAAGGGLEADTAALRVFSQFKLHQAFAECSFDRLCDVYADELAVLRMKQNNVTPVSKADMEQNATAARTKMEQHLGDCLLAGPLPSAYRQLLFGTFTFK
jgi:hypothetical protein